MTGWTWRYQQGERRLTNTDTSRQAVIVAAARTAVGKTKKGSLASMRPDEMAAAVIQELLRRTEGLDPAQVDDVILGCAFPEGEQGMNMARMVALRAGLPVDVPAQTINRFCSSGLQAIAHGAFAIAGWAKFADSTTNTNRYVVNTYKSDDSQSVWIGRTTDLGENLRPMTGTFDTYTGTPRENAGGHR